MSHTSIVIRDKETYKKFKQILLGLDKDVSGFLWEYIEIIVSKYDDGKSTLDRFLDPNYVLTPVITDPNEKWVAWLKIQDDASLYNLTSKFYRLHIYSKALGETPKQKRAQFNYSYEYVWNRYG